MDRVEAGDMGLFQRCEGAARVEAHLGRQRWWRRPDSDGGWSEGARGQSFFSRRGAIERVAHAVAPWRIRRGVRCNNPQLRSPARRCRGLRAAAAQARSGPEGCGRCARRPERLMKRLFTRLDSECSSANSRAFHTTVPQTGSRADAGATSGREPAPWMKRARPIVVLRRPGCREDGRARPLWTIPRACHAGAG